MSVVAPKLFQSTDTGAPTLSGTVGDLIEVLSSCLILRKQVSAISGASAVDNTTDARLQGGAGFKLFIGPTVTVDEAYVGLCQKFERIKFTFGTAGVQNAAVTLAWEYWNGSAWTALTVSDGTSGLTVNGVVTFAMPSDWATNAVHTVGSGTDVTCYWVRVRFTVGSWTTNPLVNQVTLTGWSEAFTGTNGRDYQMGGGNQMYLDVNDNAPSSATDARLRGYEAMSAYQTGTNPFPTVAQQATGVFFRKSAAVSAATRTWLLVADDRTFYLVASQGDGGGVYSGMGFGDFYSFVGNDPYRVFLIARQPEATALSGSNPEALFLQSMTDNISGGGSWLSYNLGQSPASRYVARSYTAVVGAVQIGILGDVGRGLMYLSTGSVFQAYIATEGCLAYPNTADGGVYVAPLGIYEGSQTAVRGRLRGLWHWLHAYNAVADRTIVVGAGVMAGQSFIIVTPGPNSTTIGPAGIQNGVACLEISDTWETN